MSKQLERQLGNRDSIRIQLNAEKISGGHLVLRSILTPPRGSLVPWDELVNKHTTYEVSIVKRKGVEVIERPNNESAAFAFYRGFLSGLAYANGQQ